MVAPKQRAVGNVAQEEIRVLVVDDSAVIRALICDLVAAAPGLSVAGRARHGREALEVIPSLRRTWSRSTSKCPTWTAWPCSMRFCVASRRR